MSLFDRLRPDYSNLDPTPDGGPWEVVRDVCPCGTRLAIVKSVWTDRIENYCGACRALGFGSQGSPKGDC